MGTTVVTDASGVRWAVRSRQLRGAGTPPPRPGPEEESLRRRLAGALARSPAPDLAPPPGDWHLPADTADVEMTATWAEFHRTPFWPGSDAWAVVQFVRLLRETMAHLRTPRSNTWEFELIARGRVRRWARWQVTGVEAARQAVATVASEVRAGRMPDPWGATLVDVVDQRPLPRPRPVR